MKIYVAGSFAGRDRIRQEAETLKRRHIVLSHWYDDDYFVEKQWDKNMGGDVAGAMAMIDAMQIQQSDMVILDTLEPSTTGGRDSELGIVLGLQFMGRPIEIYQIGPVCNIFQTLIRNKRYSSWEDFRNDNDYWF